MFIPIRFKTSVQLSPRELSDHVETILKSKLKNTLEGVCSRYGYIRPGSIELLRRSAGMFLKQHFNGYIRYEIVCSAQVCNPATGMIVPATVKNKNALGILAESSVDIDGADVPVLDIIIPRRAAGVSSEINLDNVQINDIIYVAVLGKKYQLHDRKISIIGKAVKEPNAQPDTTEGIDAVDEREARDEVDDDDAEDLDQEDEDDETDTNGGNVVTNGGEYDMYLMDGGLMEDFNEQEGGDGSVDGGESDDEESGGGYYGGGNYDD
jgi:DNA-directed RNA polymerase subunit E'/Rpb7